MFNSVDLPDPDGPTIAIASPRSTMRSTPRSAWTGGSVPYARLTSSSSTTGTLEARRARLARHRQRLHVTAHRCPPAGAGAGVAGRAAGVRRRRARRARRAPGVGEPAPSPRRAATAPSVPDASSASTGACESVGAFDATEAVAAPTTTRSPGLSAPRRAGSISTLPAATRPGLTSDEPRPAGTGVDLHARPPVGARRTARSAAP